MNIFLKFTIKKPTLNCSEKRKKKIINESKIFIQEKLSKIIL